MFADSACTQPVAAVSSGCTAPGYAMTMDTNSCGPTGGGIHLFSLGAASSPTQLYVQANSQCFAAGPAASGYSYYTVGAEYPGVDLRGRDRGPRLQKRKTTSAS